jgi:hypothetical protein
MAVAGMLLVLDLVSLEMRRSMIKLEEAYIVEMFINRLIV